MVHILHLLRMAHGIWQAESRSVLQGLPKREIRKEDVLLQHIADLTLPPLAQLVAVEINMPAVKPQATTETIQQCGLAAPGRTHNGQQLTGSHQPVHIAQNLAIAHADGEATKGEVHRQRAVIGDETWKWDCCLIGPATKRRMLPLLIWVTAESRALILMV